MKRRGQDVSCPWHDKPGLFNWATGQGQLLKKTFVSGTIFSHCFLFSWFGVFVCLLVGWLILVLIFGWLIVFGFVFTVPRSEMKGITLRSNLKTGQSRNIAWGVKGKMEMRYEKVNSTCKYKTCYSYFFQRCEKTDTNTLWVGRKWHHKVLT